MKRLQFARAGTVVNDGFIGPQGLITVDTDRWELRLHDNETPGGHRILNLEQLLEIFMSKDSEFGSVVFAEDGRGILTRIGDRQYALRKIIGYNGIHVTEAATGNVDNQDGEAADFYVGLNPDDLAALLLGLASGKLLYAGLSAGTADALTLTVPAGWKNDQGSIVAFKSHLAVNDSATMQITVGATPGGVLPLMTAGGSNKVSQLIKLGTVPLLMRIDRIDTGSDNSLIGDDDQILTGYRCIGFMTAKEIGIAPISGMTATNVQDALAELKVGLGGGGGGGNDSSFWTFANFNQSPTGATSAFREIPIAKGDRKLIRAVSAASSRHSGGSGGGNVVVAPPPITINGVSLGITQGAQVVIDVSFSGPGQDVFGMLHREMNQLWFCPFVDIGHHTASSKYRVSSKIDIGSIDDAATTVRVTPDSTRAFPAWSFSDIGVVVA